MPARPFCRLCSAYGQSPPASRESLCEAGSRGAPPALPGAMSRGEQIKLSEAEVVSFLEAERTVTCATIGPRRWPHLMPLWYVLRDAPTEQGTGLSESAAGKRPRIWAWTYA